MLEQSTQAELRGLGGHVGWSYVGYAVGLAAGLATTAHVFRVVSARSFGVLALITAVTTAAELFAGGINASIVDSVARRAVAGAEAEAEARAGHYVAILAALAACGVLATTVFGLAHLGVSSEVVWAVSLLGSAAVLSVGLIGLRGLAAGAQAFRALTVCSSLGAATRVGVVLWGTRSLGLVAVGAAAIGATLVERALLLLWAKRHATWFKLIVRRPRADDVRHVRRFVAPVMSLVYWQQVLASGDVLVMSFFVPVSVVGIYKLGSLLPNQASNAFNTGHDTIYPVLARANAGPQRDHLVRFLTRVGCYGAGLLFGGLAGSRADAVLLLGGTRSALAESVVVILCVGWTVATTARGLTLSLIAQRRNRQITALYLGEATVNVALTLVLVPTLGPIGAAWSTLITLSLGHLIVVPLIGLRDLNTGTFRLILVDGLFRGALGFGLAMASLACLSLVMSPSVWRFAAGGLLVGAVGLGAGAVLASREDIEQFVAMFRRSGPPASLER